MRLADETFLGKLVNDAKARVRGGYYQVDGEVGGAKASLVEALGAKGRIPVIAEVKFRSPSEGVLAEGSGAAEIARAYERGGAAAVSVLTEPRNFGGSLDYLARVKKAVNVPVLMKDIVVDRVQVEAASRAGADAVLLIAAAFGPGLADFSLEELEGFSHDKGLEVVVEVHDEKELEYATAGEGDVVGINNRDLRTLSVSLDTSRMLLKPGPHPKPIICESGISGRGEIESLRRLGADGFLVGSALMRADDPEAALKKLTRVEP